MRALLDQPLRARELPGRMGTPKPLLRGPGDGALHLQLHMAPDGAGEPRRVQLVRLGSERRAGQQEIRLHYHLYTS